MNHLLDNPLFLWSIGMVFIIPILVILLGEMIERLRKRDSAYATGFEILRNICLPALTFVLITTVMLGLGPELITSEDGSTLVRHNFGSIIQRLTVTFLYFAVSITILAFIAAMNDNAGKKDRWESQVPTIAKTVVRALAVILPFALVVTSVWNLDLSKFVTAIGIGSVAIAFALQNTLASVVSGILLALDKPFKEGDWIEVDGQTGRVIDLNWRTTRIEVDGRDVVILPNTVLLDSSLKNYTVLDIGYRDKIAFGFAYKDKPNKVKRVALQVAAESAYVAEFPPPEVHTIAYDDSSIGYEMHFHMDEYESAFQARRIREDLLTRLYYAAEREGLEIPFPIRTVRETHTGDLTDEERQDIALSALKDIEGTLKATDESLIALAKSAIIESYGKGTPIAQIGDYEAGIRLILSGSIEVCDANGNVLASDVECLLLPMDVIDDAMDRDASLARSLHALADARIDHLHLVAAGKSNERVEETAENDPPESITEAIELAEQEDKV